MLIDSKVNAVDTSAAALLGVSKGRGKLAFYDPRAELPFEETIVLHQPVRDFKFSPSNPNEIVCCYSDKMAVFDLLSRTVLVRRTAHSVCSEGRRAVRELGLEWTRHLLGGV